jgi:hypothetical protein
VDLHQLVKRHSVGGPELFGSALLQWLSSVVALLLMLIIAITISPTSAHGQELLNNRSFETPVTPANGNNFYASIPNWTVANVVPANPFPFNVIRPWAGYGANPLATPTGGDVQYIDINSAAGTLVQSVTFPTPGMVDLSGWFSVRDNQQALSGLVINIRNSGNVIVASASTSFLATDPIGLWKLAGAWNIPVAAGAHTFEVELPNPANFDLASLVFKPAVVVGKTSTILLDPISSANPKAIPGAIVEYTLTATTPESYTVSNNSLSLTDATPANMALVVTNADAPGNGPAFFAPGSSGLSYSFVSFASDTDDVEFSNNSGLSWTYTPTAGTSGTDPAVTTVRLLPKGIMAANSTFTFRLRYSVN